MLGAQMRDVQSHVDLTLDDQSHVELTRDDLHWIYILSDRKK